MQRRPDPPPREADDARVVAVGAAVWAVLLVVLLPFTGRLRDAGHLWWLATCALGAGLGLVGLVVLRRRNRRAGRRAAQHGALSATADRRPAPTPHP